METEVDKADKRWDYLKAAVTNIPDDVDDEEYQQMATFKGLITTFTEAVRKGARSIDTKRLILYIGEETCGWRQSNSCSRII